MKFFIDESLSPQLATRLNLSGRYDAMHPLHLGRRGEPDHVVLAFCIAEDRIIVTQNARDFRKLIGKVEIQPGVIILPSIDREGTWLLLEAAVTHLEALGNPIDILLNHVLEVESVETMTLAELPTS